MDLWVNGWFPLHNSYKKAFESGAETLGYVAKGGALQGYLVDKKTADAHNIKTIEDFKKPEIRKLFDNDGDGKAELVACPPGWGCEKVIAHQLDAYKLRDYVEPIKAAYAASMADALGRYKSGGSIFFYTWIIRICQPTRRTSKTRPRFPTSRAASPTPVRWVGPRTTSGPSRTRRFSRKIRR
jgi:glycine betaine/proline transport system substrate-binding protein